jgi:hypothetical protein
MADKNLPVFVKINEYKEILNIMDVMKQKLKDTRQSLARVRELKMQEDQEIAEWERNVAEINKRISFIDSAFFENE